MPYMNIKEYRQQIKRFRLKYVFWVGKIILTAGCKNLKLLDRMHTRAVSLLATSEQYPCKDIYIRALA